jgi:hypothetical protein
MGKAVLVSLNRTYTYIQTIAKHGRDALPALLVMDKIVNYTGREPSPEYIDPPRGEVTAR